MRRRRRGAAEWAAVIDQWKQSGLDLPEFCQRQGLNRGTMQGWVYKSALKRAIESARRDGRDPGATASPESTPAGPAPSPAFVPVRFAEAAATSQRSVDYAAIEVVLGGGRRVAVGPGFDEPTLRRVVAALESRPC